jgi:hypothetical protein
VRLQSWRCKPFVDASRRFGLSRHRQKLGSTNRASQCKLVGTSV